MMMMAHTIVVRTSSHHDYMITTPRKNEMVCEDNHIVAQLRGDTYAPVSITMNRREEEC